MRFKNYLNETNKKIKEIPWNKNPKINWWLDNDPMIFYHGTHINNLENISKNGLISSGWISLALDPYTAHGYAVMMGGEKTFTKAGGKAKILPSNKRAILKIEIPKDKVLKNMAPERGAMKSTKNKLKDKSLYLDAKEKNVPDYKYYELTEIRMPKKIDPKYIKGYMIK